MNLKFCCSQDLTTWLNGFCSTTMCIYCLSQCSVAIKRYHDQDKSDNKKHLIGGLQVQRCVHYYHGLKHGGRYTDLMLEKQLRATCWSTGNVFALYTQDFHAHLGTCGFSRCVYLFVETLWAFVCQCVVCVYNVCSICSCMLPWACVSISITGYLCVLQGTYTLWLSLIFPCVLFPVSSGSQHQGQGYVHPSSVCLCLSGDVYAIPMLFSLRDTVDSGDWSRRERWSKDNF